MYSARNGRRLKIKIEGSDLTLIELGMIVSPTKAGGLVHTCPSSVLRKPWAYLWRNASA